MMLQTSRHIIQLRQIEDKILKAVHFPRSSKVVSLTQAHRRAILDDMRAEIEDWYSSGCLVSPVEADNVPIHNSVTWLNARYYHLLILLYYPSQFNALGSTGGSVVSRAELLRFAQKQLQSTSVLFQQRQLPLNAVTLSRVFPIGLVLMHGLIAHVQDGRPFPARDEVAVVIRVLDAFHESWQPAHQLANVFRRFMDVVDLVAANSSGSNDSNRRGSAANAYANFAHMYMDGGPVASVGAQGGPTSGGVDKESCQTLMRPIMAAFLSSMQTVLGQTTCYAFQDLPEDPEAGTVLGQQPQQQPQQQQQQQLPPQSLTSPVADERTVIGIHAAITNENMQMNYNWATLELDFL
jgi:hypothetical protein